MRLIGRSELDLLLSTNVCEVQFVRRHDKPGSPGVRQMLATKDWTLLNSTNGRLKLNYRPPKHSKHFNEIEKNLITVWDIIMQDYRNINMDQCYLVEVVSRGDFWDLYNKSLIHWPVDKKRKFMN